MGHGWQFRNPQTLAPFVSLWQEQVELPIVPQATVVPAQESAKTHCPPWQTWHGPQVVSFAAVTQAPPSQTWQVPQAPSSFAATQALPWQTWQAGTGQFSARQHDWHCPSPQQNVSSPQEPPGSTQVVPTQQPSSQQTPPQQVPRPSQQAFTTPSTVQMSAAGQQLPTPAAQTSPAGQPPQGSGARQRPSRQTIRWPRREQQLRLDRQVCPRRRHRQRFVRLWQKRVQHWL